MAYTYPYPRPALTVDCVVFGWDKDSIKVLLIRRGVEPYKGEWALPGGFVHIDEELIDAATRELREETGITDPYLEQLYTFGEKGRDPRGHVVTVAYYALIDMNGYAPPKADTDANEAKWFGLNEIPPLAFDHPRIFECALERLKGKVRYKPVGFELLPEKFSLTQLQLLYETILETELDKRNFRKKLMGMGLLIEMEEYEQDVPHRAAKLFRFDMVKYKQLEKNGFQFKI